MATVTHDYSSDPGLTMLGSEISGGALIPQDLDEGSVLQLNGSSEYAEKTISNYRSGDSAGTFACWFKTTATGTQYMFDSSDTVGTNYFINFGMYSDGQVFWQQKDGLPDTTDRVETDDQFNDGSWHFFAATSNGTTITLYVDGQSVAISVGIGSNSGDWFADTIGETRDKITIGRIGYASPFAYWDGEIDLVEVYSVALTAAEVHQLYSTGDCDQTPVNGWPCNEGSGTTVGDDYGSDDLTTQAGAWSSAEPSFYARKSRTTSNDMLA